MHEAALAKRILNAALETVRARGGRRIVSVHGWIANAELLNRTSIEAQFAANATGTIAEGAHLELQLDHVEARCAECGALYLPAGHLTLCPRCGSPDAELTGKTGIGIESVEIED